MINKVFLYLNTIKYLKPVQIFYQLKYKIFKMRPPRKKRFSKINDIHLSNEILDLDESYLSRFSSYNILNRRIEMLNLKFELNLTDWNNPDANPLWNFNLHYLEFLISLASDFRKSGETKYYNGFKEILNSWIEVNNDHKGSGWHPYTISLRIINILICIDIFGEIFNKDITFKDKVFLSIYEQFNFLLHNQEKHLLGNHYFENLNTIIICSILFNDIEIYELYIEKYIEEINEQILPDGVHFERSIMYHKIVLERIIRTSSLIKNYDNSYNVYFEDVITRMSDALISLEKGMGKTPHFNDSADGVAKNTESLIDAVIQMIDYNVTIKHSFPDSGYFKVYSNDISLMFDIGDLGPSYMSGHGHCDVLSFELSKNNQPIFVNSGTYNYQTSLRGFFRSTEAHNTFMVGDTQQAQVWGEHRVGKRISELDYKILNYGVKGSLINYKGDYQARSIEFKKPDKLLIKDNVQTKRDEIIFGYLHFAPGLRIIKESNNIFIVLQEDYEVMCKIEFSHMISSNIHTHGKFSCYSDEFGMLESKNVLEFKWDSKLQMLQIMISFIREEGE